jgi:exopolysaccharide biosynthesis polyprenyl glycosylphosphotransferase
VSRETLPARPPPAVERAAAGDVRAATPAAVASPVRSLARRLASIAVLVGLDIAGVALGLYTALALRELYYGQEPLWGLLWEAEERWLPFLVLVTVLVFWRADLYAPRERRPGVIRVLPSLLLVAIVSVAFALGSGHEFNTFGFAPTAVLTSIAFVGLLRGSYETLTRDLLGLLGTRRRTVLMGEHVGELRRSLGADRGGIRYEFVGVVSRSPAADGLPRLGDPRDLALVLDAHGVDELIVTDADYAQEELLELVDQAHRRGVKVLVAPKTTELIRHRAEYLPGQGSPLFELRPPVFAGVDWAVKRAFDVAVSALAVVVGLPIWLVIAAAIKLDSRGPVLFRDRRIGVGEREFGMLKFRTMVADAPELQPALEGRNEAEGALFKIRDDPRVTRVGAVLRRFSIDEIPQVLNVLRGEMSLVGPRPLPLRDYRRLEDWHRKRYLVLPGMTGLWQIAGRSQLSFDDLVRLDFYYLDNWSVWLDIAILAKTLPAVLRRRGAY